MSDFEEAKDKVMLGVERKSLVLSEDERKLTAYHEAGHAVVSLMIARATTRSTRSPSCRAVARSGS